MFHLIFGSYISKCHRSSVNLEKNSQHDKKKRSTHKGIVTNHLLIFIYCGTAYSSL